jgi:hypothetical protein
LLNATAVIGSRYFSPVSKKEHGSSSRVHHWLIGLHLLVCFNVATWMRANLQRKPGGMRLQSSVLF